MSFKRRSYFSFDNMIVPWHDLSLALLGIWFFPREQLKPLYTSGIGFHPFHSWMKKIIQEKFKPKTFGV